MKTIQTIFTGYGRLLLITVLSPFTLIPFQGKAQTLQVTATTCNIEVEAQYRTKDMLGLLTGEMNVARYLTPTGFSVTSTGNNLKEQLEGRLAQLSLPYISIAQVKDVVTAASLEKAGGVDCPQASLLCSNTSQSANSSGAGTQELSATAQGCLAAGEHQSSWYYLNVQTAGTLTFTIAPTNAADDYDFAVWGPYTAATASANCPPLTAPLRCSYSSLSGNTGLMIPFTGQTSALGCGFLGLSPCSGLITSANNPVDDSEGAGGDKWVRNLTVLANEIYIVLVDNFSNSGNPYDLSFGGTGVLGCTPVVLPVELSAFTGLRSAAGNIFRWTTESEYKSGSFNVEWASNPGSEGWTSIAEVSAAGYSESHLEYSAIHKTSVPRSVNYYRLVQTDTDGNRHVYSDRIVVIDNSAKQLNPVKIINLLGQEVSAEAPGMVIYIFEDGTSLKVMQ